MANEVVESMTAPSHRALVVDAEEPYDSYRTNSGDDEGVEVVMDPHGKSSVMDQHVFRGPPHVRPRAIRGGPPPHVQGSGSYGYPSHDYHGRPYPVPYGLSGSFDEGGPYPHSAPNTHSQYSPQVPYAPHGGRHSEDVNVISPHHATPKLSSTPSRRGGYGHYQYPPTSPVSRPGDDEHSPPRVRNYAMRRPEGPPPAASRGQGHPDDGVWSYSSAPGAGERQRPPLVAESFDSEPYSSRPPHYNPSPNAPHYGPPIGGAEPPYTGSFYGASFGGSFDSQGPHPPPPPPQFDPHRYYGHPPPYSHPPESPYSPYGAPYNGYSPGGGYYDPYSPHPDYRRGPHGHTHTVSPHDRKKDNNCGMLLPKAAEEIDFDVTDPPSEPHTPPSKVPVCESPADVNSYDVLCGRGGGTNSQVGNRRFRKLVEDFQPIYLLARRKEKPLLARTIVLIIRKRGGRFLKKDEETGELYEVGDTKAEAKTSQALREGLDVRATKSAATNLMDKKSKKKGKNLSDDEDKTEDSPEDTPDESSPAPVSSTPNIPSPPVLPRLNPDEKPPPSPESSSMQFRKRRRVRSSDGSDPTGVGCGTTGFQDKLFSDFCPPRAEIGRPGSPSSPTPPHDINHTMGKAQTFTRSNIRYEDDDDDDDIRAEQAAQTRALGCAGIAMDLVTGAAAGSFCIGPRSWAG